MTMFKNKEAALNHALFIMHQRAGYQPEDHPQVFEETHDWITLQVASLKDLPKEPSHESIMELANVLEKLCAPVVGEGLKAHSVNDSVLKDWIKDIRFKPHLSGLPEVAYGQFAYLLVANRS